MDQQEVKYYQYTSSKDPESMINYIIKQDSEQKDPVWQNVLEEMKRQALKLLQNKPKKQLIMIEQKEIQFTREEAFGFLSLMYFGLTEHQKERNKFNQYHHMLRLNQKNNSVAFQKLQCIKDYFLHYIQLNPEQQQDKIKITKCKLDPKYHVDQFFQNYHGNLDIDCWKQSSAELGIYEINDISMFDQKDEQITIVDFADPFIGGLVLDEVHCAQEEVLMCLYPEAIISSLFFSKLAKDESIYIENVLRSNNHSGYEQSFRHQSIDLPLKSHNIIAIDAYPFANENQFDPIWIQRELNKAFVGFSLYQESDRNRNIVSGKWGCGIFGGDVFLKIMIQIASFSQSLVNIKEGRKPKLILSFYSIKNINQDKQSYYLQKNIQQWLEGIKTVGQLVKKLVSQKQRMRL